MKVASLELKISTLIRKIRKFYSRGALYSLRIELYKIILDPKYSQNMLKPILLKIMNFLAKKLKLRQPSFILKIVDRKFNSFAQLNQDLFVLDILNYKNNGFFLEVGAGDGVNLSNTYLLERDYGWTGILVEPNRNFYDKCCLARKCTVINKLLLNSPQTSLKFYEKKIGEFSHSEGYGNFLASEILREYEVPTIKFENLFTNFSPTLSIDFLSIDTEGSEREILDSVDFSVHSPLIICIEHNYDKKNRLYYKRYLKNKGYKLKYPGISRWDSWFVLKSKP